METKPHSYWTPKWLERLRARDQSRASKHANGKQKPRNHRKMLRAKRKRQRQARKAQRKR